MSGTTVEGPASGATVTPVAGELCPFCGYAPGCERADRCPECGRELGRSAEVLRRFRRRLAWRASDSAGRMRVAKSIVLVLALLLSLLTGSVEVMVLVVLAIGMVVGAGAVFGPLTGVFAKPHEREVVTSVWRRNEGWLHVPWVLAPLAWLPHAILIHAEVKPLVQFIVAVVYLSGPLWLYAQWLARMLGDGRRASVGTSKSRLVAGMSGLVLVGMATVLGLGVILLGMVVFGGIG
ncbi:MAG: hypothetical protein HEQ23_08010 [Tepidisphaera sp.]